MDDLTATDKPNVARIYDYLLGGFHNFEADRKAAEKVLESRPQARHGAQLQRAFLRRAVTYCVEQGIDQFLDIGSGLPTMGNVHELAQAHIPDAKVVYVDIDRVAVAHSRAILEDNPYVTAMQGDAACMQEILDHDEVRALLDFARPLAVLLVTVMHFVPEEQVYDAMETLRNSLAPGSHLIMAHLTLDGLPPETAEKMGAAYKRAGNAIPRTLAQIEAMLGDFDLLEPGLVRPPAWRPEDPDAPEVTEHVSTWAGVARKK